MRDQCIVHQRLLTVVFSASEGNIAEGNIAKRIPKILICTFVQHIY